MQEHDHEIQAQPLIRIPLADPADNRLSRRAFLARSGGVAIGLTGSLSVAAGGATLLLTTDRSTSPPRQRWVVPLPPAEPPRQITVLTDHEATTIEALMGRLLPGTADDPGAREAGAIYYLDHMLAAAGGFPEPTYRTGPYARTFEGDEPPTDEATALADGIVWVPASEIERYGYQSPLTPLEVMQVGVRAVDAYAIERFGSPLAELSDEQLDQIIAALLDNEATGFELFSPEAFFHVLRRRTDEGMFSDPLYGGNIDFAGWRLVGYPGAQRAYTESDIRTPGSPRPPQGLEELHPFNPGQPSEHGNVILPVSGSDEEWPRGTDPETEREA